MHKIAVQIIITFAHGIELNVLNRIFQTEIPDGSNYNTLDGLLRDTLGVAPQNGDGTEISGLRMVIEETEGNKLTGMRAEKVDT